MNRQQRDGAYYIGNAVSILGEKARNLEIYP